MVAPRNRNDRIPKGAIFQLRGSSTYADGLLKHAEITQKRVEGKTPAEGRGLSETTWSLTLVN